MIAFGTVFVTMWWLTDLLAKRVRSGFAMSALIVLATWIIAPIVGATVGVGIAFIMPGGHVATHITSGIVYGMFFMALSPFIVAYLRRQRVAMNVS